MIFKLPRKCLSSRWNNVARWIYNFLPKNYFFGAICACGIVGATSSGVALVTSFAGLPVAGWLGSFGARGFNRLGKYAYHMGNVTSGNLTNTTAISDLMT